MRPCTYHAFNSLQKLTKGNFSFFAADDSIQYNNHAAFTLSLQQLESINNSIPQQSDAAFSSLF